jgi:hypothetical protein
MMTVAGERSGRSQQDAIDSTPLLRVFYNNRRPSQIVLFDLPSAFLRVKSRAPHWIVGSTVTARGLRRPTEPLLVNFPPQRGAHTPNVRTSARISLSQLA